MKGWVLQGRFLVMCCLVGFGFSFERQESFGGGGREGIEERKIKDGNRYPHVRFWYYSYPIQNLTGMDLDTQTQPHQVSSIYHTIQ